MPGSYVVFDYGNFDFPTAPDYSFKFAATGMETTNLHTALWQGWFSAEFQFVFEGIAVSGVPPGRIRQCLLHDLGEFALESAVVFDTLLAFFGYLFANRLGSWLPLNETGPAIVSTVEFWWAGLTGTVRLSALAFGS